MPTLQTSKNPVTAKGLVDFKIPHDSSLNDKIKAEKIKLKNRDLSSKEKDNIITSKDSILKFLLNEDMWNDLTLDVKIGVLEQLYFLDELSNGFRVSIPAGDSLEYNLAVAKALYTKNTKDTNLPLHLNNLRLNWKQSIVNSQGVAPRIPNQQKLPEIKKDPLNQVKKFNPGEINENKLAPIPKSAANVGFNRTKHVESIKKIAPEDFNRRVLVEEMKEKNGDLTKQLKGLRRKQINYLAKDVERLGEVRTASLTIRDSAKWKSLNKEEKLDKLEKYMPRFEVKCMKDPNCIYYRETINEIKSLLAKNNVSDKQLDQCRNTIAGICYKIDTRTR